MREEFAHYCHEGVFPEIVINNKEHLNLEQHIAVLKRIRKTIEAEPLYAEDSEEIGNKHTETNWGMCSDRADHYPEPELHQFPQDFVDRGRSTPLESKTRPCPFRLRNQNRGTIGCFHDCVIFQRPDHPPSRDYALAVFDAAIEREERKL